MNKTMNKIILAVMVVAVVVITGYFMFIKKLGPVIYQMPTPAQDETADWKTYSNSEYGLQLKYPATWFLSESSYTERVESGALLRINMPWQKHENPEDGYFPDMEIFYWKDMKTRNNMVGWPINKIGEININGQNADEVITSMNGGVNYAIIFYHKGVYELNFPLVPERSKLSKELQLILSTFKFTK